MPRPWRIRYPGAKYHITVRGNGRRDVFHEASDYERFLMQLCDALEKDDVILYAYALLPNHYHLFIETPHANVQRFMQRLNTAYSMYHRFKHAEPGHCFQGRYGAKLVGGDEYIVALTRYIHLNPVKIKPLASEHADVCVQMLRQYPWSSYCGYIQADEAEPMVDYRWLELMGGRKLSSQRRRYQRYVEFFVKNQDDLFMEANKASRYAVGDDRFIEQVESDLHAVRENRGVYGDIKWPEGCRIALGYISNVVAKDFDLRPRELKTRASTVRVAKKLAIELCCQLSGQSQRSVGEYFGYKGNGSVAKQRESLRKILETDECLAKQFNRLKKEIACG